MWLRDLVAGDAAERKVRINIAHDEKHCTYDIHLYIDYAEQKPFDMKMVDLWYRHYMNQQTDTVWKLGKVHIHDYKQRPTKMLMHPVQWCRDLLRIGYYYLGMVKSHKQDIEVSKLPSALRNDWRDYGDEARAKLPREKWGQGVMPSEQEVDDFLKQISNPKLESARLHDIVAAFVARMYYKRIPYSKIPGQKEAYQYWETIKNLGTKEKQVVDTETQQTRVEYEIDSASIQELNDDGGDQFVDEDAITKAMENVALAGSSGSSSA